VDEHDLRGLGDTPAGPGEHGRPVEAVLRRARQLRRRRRVRRGLGAGLLVVGVLGAGSLFRGPGHAPDLATEPSPAPDLCSRWAQGLASSTDTPPDGSTYAPVDDAAGLLFLPTHLPDGLAPTVASAWRDEPGCPNDPVLALENDSADGDDTTVDATIKLLGPYGAPLDDLSYGDAQTTTPTRLRHADATLVTLAPRTDPTGDHSLVAFTWTDAAGASWLLEGLDVDEATLRAVAGALRLDASSTPPADIAPSDLPAGWQLTWRSPIVPTRIDRVRPATISWNLELGRPPGGCRLWFEPTAPDEAPERALAYPGQRLTTVRGQAALEVPGFGLRWIEPRGVRVRISCQVDTDQLPQLAGSLQPVDADDPRLPVG
jgi:hypothetical protein